MIGQTAILLFGPEPARRGQVPGGVVGKRWTNDSNASQTTSPHPLTLDSRGRLFVGNRSNGRVHIFEPDGTFVPAWLQFGRPGSMFIDEDDVLYVTDSTSNARNNPGFDRGIYIGSAVDGTVHAYIPDPDLDRQDELRISGASGITADREGNVYAADVGPQRIRKYVRR